MSAGVTLETSAAPVTTQSTIRPPFRADIEGLRAVAILLVVLYHAGVPSFRGGFVGVDVFFVLSGYLISWLLVQEVERTGTVGLLSFYGRRARRLLPGLALMLVVTMAAAAFVYAPYEQRFLANSAAATAGYFSNIYFARAALDYHGAAAGANPFLHTWSLSVEEQFYLVWPLFVLIGSGALLKRQSENGKRRLLVWMILAAAISFALSLLLTSVRPTAAFFLSPARAWEFALGAIGLLLPMNLARKFLPAGIGNLVNPRFGILGWIGLVGIILAGVMFGLETPFPGVAALLPTVSTVFVLRAPAGSIFTRFLSIRPLTEIGRLSYSWYLWHWPLPVLIEALSGPLSLPVRLGLMVLALGLAELSYRLVEHRIHHSRKLALRPAYSLLMAAAITISSIAFALYWRHGSMRWASSPEQVTYTKLRLDLPIIYSMDCDQDYFSTELKECSFGSANAAHTAVLFGDSHAGQWFPTVESALVEKGWRLIVLTKSACPIVDSPFYYPPIGRVFSECELWRGKAVEKIRAIQPDMVIIGSAQYRFSSDQLRSGTEKVLTKLSSSSRLVLLMKDTPRLESDPANCLARSNWRLGFFPKTDCNPALITENGHADMLEVLARSFPNVLMVDMNPFICDEANCKAVKDGMFVFRDDNHISNAFAKRLAGDFARQIESRSQILRTVGTPENSATR